MKAEEPFPLKYIDSETELKPQWVIEMINETTKGEAIVTTDVGQHQMWAAQYYKFNKSAFMGYFRWSWYDGLRIPVSDWCSDGQSG